MLAQPMSRGERSRAPIRERRQKYSAPDPSRIRETTLSHLLPRQRVLPAAPGNLFKSDGQTTTERVVWYAGDAALLERPCVAVVGTREASNEGRARARRLGRELAEQGVVVVSGLAKGIDTEALTAAISAGGVVVAVIGTPIDRAYPAENAPLQEKIAAEHLLISQFASGSMTFPSSFPVRNRLMAALSDATVIIEASDSSGTLHQAAECVRLDRWLFIARSVMADRTLEWPSKFSGYPKVQTLDSTEALTAVLGAQP